jgi:glutathione S-transferase
MTLALYGHPFSSYTQKVLIALYENATPFEFRVLSPDAPANFTQLKQRWPLAKFPLLVDGAVTMFESTSIIEHLQLRHPGPVHLLPQAPDAAIDVRQMDRIFDNYVMTPMNRIVQNARRAPQDRDPLTVAESRALLEAVYRWLDQRLAGHTWAVQETFTLADCAAAPALLYADWVHPITDELVSLRAYRTRLLVRPSYARAVDEARPYRPLFPPGAPDRD